jgi:hypothetical protein
MAKVGAVVVAVLLGLAGLYTAAKDRTFAAGEIYDTRRR